MRDRLKNKITISAYCIIAVCLLLSMTAPRIFAENNDSIAATEALRSVMNCNDVFVNLLADDNTKLYDTFCGLDDGTAFSGAFDAATDVFKVVGFLLTIAAAMGKLFQKYERGQEGSQMVIGAITSICIAGMVIMNIDTTTGTIGKLGQAICEQVIINPNDEESITTERYAEAVLELYTGQPSGSQSWANEASSQLDGIGLINCLGFYGIYVLLISKFLEIGIMRVFAPLCIYDIYDEGLRSAGAMFLKRILAAYLSIAMAAICASMSYLVQACLASPASIENAVSKGLTEYQAAEEVAPFVPTVCTMVVFKAMTKTDDLANKVMGL